jgi:cephalosporin hydroxylase
VSIKPNQVRYEVAKLLDVLAEVKPKVILEIGTAGGGTLFLFTRVADPEAKIISVDLPGGLLWVDGGKMKVNYDPEADILYIIIREGP